METSKKGKSLEFYHLLLDNQELGEQLVAMNKVSDIQNFCKKLGFDGNALEIRNRLITYLRSKELNEPSQTLYDFVAQNESIKAHYLQNFGWQNPSITWFMEHDLMNLDFDRIEFGKVYEKLGGVF